LQEKQVKHLVNSLTWTSKYSLIRSTKVLAMEILKTEKNITKV